MDLSLDLTRLSAALGVDVPEPGSEFDDDEQVPLPSPEQLQKLLASAEIELFLNRLRVDSRLLETAWYLHGVASADRALEMYSVPRQRQAFSVSAHIFDLACNDAHQPADLRRRQAFAAQVGFHRSEGEPNAAALGRRVDSWSLTDSFDDLPIIDRMLSLAIRAGISVLSLNPSTSTKRLREWRRELLFFASEAQIEDLGSTIFGPTFLVVEASHQIMRHLTHGDAEALGLARDALTRAVSKEHLGHDHEARWIASHLRFVADEMSEGSVWNLFPSETPKAAKQAFTITAPQVLTLWKPQRQLLKPEPDPDPWALVPPIASQTKRLVLSVPTSAGKTLMAQILMVNYLATSPSGVCYVAPQRSLGREVRKALTRRLHMIAKEVGRLEPDYGLPSHGSLADFLRQMDDPFALIGILDGIESEDPEPDVAIMTPERLAHALRNDPEGVLAKYGMFVFDEAHQVRDGKRGFLLESVISFLNWRTLDTDHRIVLLSAAMGNAGQIQQWIDPRGISRPFESSWRGPRRLSVLFGTERARTSPTVTHVSAGGRMRHLPQRHTFPLYGVLRLKPAGEKEVTLRTSEPIGEVAYRATARGYREPSPENGKGTTQEELLARITLYFGHAGPVLVVCNSRKAVQRIASHLAAHLDTNPKSALLATTARIKLGDEHFLSQALLKGVAYHHAGLPTDLLEGIEEGVRSGSISYLVSTSTLTDGVNLPVHTVVIHNPTYDGISEDQLVTGARLVNAIGRAGRAAQETEGWVVMSHFARTNSSDFARLTPDEGDLSVVSTLNSESALEDLEKFEEEYRNSEDVLFSARGKAADFQSYVWHLLATEEQAGRMSSEMDLDDALRHTLGFLQMSEGLRRRFRALASVTHNKYEDTEPQLRRAWSKTGTSISSARLICETALEVAERLSSGEVACEVALDAVTVLTDMDVWATLLGLPECPRTWKFRQTISSRSAAVEINPDDLVRAWLSGDPLPTIAGEVFSQITDRTHALELVVDVTSDFCEHYFAWLVGILIERVNELLRTRGSFVLICPELATYIRHGVRSQMAVELLTAGIRSRELANSVATHATLEGIEGLNLRDWLGSLALSDWRERFDAKGSDLLDLLEYSRARGSSLLRDILSNQSSQIECGDFISAPTDSPTKVTLTRMGFGPEPGPIEISLAFEGNLLLLPTVSNTEEHRGSVPTRYQDDLQQVLLSGLDVRYSLSGTVLSISLERDIDYA